MYKSLSLLSFIFILCACSLSPKLPTTQTQFTASVSEYSVSKEWWKQFNDENLNTLIHLALRNNSDLKLTFIHMQQAAAQLGISLSDFFPQIDATGSANRKNIAANSPNNRTNTSGYTNDFAMGFNVSYELDLWGKLRNTYRAKNAAFKASQYDYEASRLSLLSNVVQLYFNLANAYENEKALQQANNASKQIYEIITHKYTYGAVGEYELSQAKANLISTSLQYQQAQLNKENLVKALKILVSNELDEILYKQQDYQDYNVSEFDIPKGISSTILLKRPDIQASLERLLQQNYLIGVARTAFLPSLSLTGLFGFESTDLSTLVKNGSQTWNIGGNFAMPIFHWGEIYQNVNLAKLSQDEAFITYENTLKTAFGEIRYALIEHKNMRLQIDNAVSNELAYRKIYEIAKQRYELGEMSLQEYLDTKQQWLNATILYNNTKYNYANSIVNVIKAFGGGFDTNENLSIEHDSQSLDLSFQK
ncbi:TolC family protein [Campylobacter sp. MIT 21-1685]|uniref:efflux transporter outer membrane subunit n=1 Tax=unclassified Campylobacter TaxID=2593542 RepID=UPI00224A809F|nr:MULTISPECIES: TolC family protein [unclassified Campylobacter]MCX2683492.1 TolC family protein [Campylobacter sp. MIT 21-1684]MCX2751773.1 TolC family protein [Campylobacter sp. MIT 21-1682]MCX2807974.1 TolC family protein [Campylobacter sp. MIT 21-1685]